MVYLSDKSVEIFSIPWLSLSWTLFDQLCRVEPKGYALTLDYEFDSYRTLTWLSLDILLAETCR